MARAIGSVVEKGAERLNRRKSVRPPGAVEEPAFMALCDLCGKCWEACESGAIRQAVGGGMLEGTPVIDPGEAPCWLCESVACSKACPRGALNPVERDEVKIGVAKINESTCFFHQGMDKSCDYCYDRCPLKDKAIVFDGGPVVNEDLCSGCGVCEYYCVSNPKSIVVSPL